MSSLRESTLTTPEDRQGKNFKLDTTTEPLTDCQTENAMEKLNKKFLKKEIQKESTK